MASSSTTWRRMPCSRSRRRGNASRCCIPPTTTTTASCAPSSNGAAAVAAIFRGESATMLTHLQIRDFAIIDSIELEFRPGLTVLTGETGAGKSIVVDALQLLCGGRGGAEVIRAGAERAEIAATFDLLRAPRELKRWLDEQSITAESELAVRRAIDRKRVVWGKSE